MQTSLVTIALATFLIGGPAEAGQSEGVDRHWLPWLGCWQLSEEEFQSPDGTAPLELESREVRERTSVCLTMNGPEVKMTVSEGDQLLVEQMLDTVLAELLVGVQNDPQFGLVMTLAGGGTLVELMADSTTILLPTDRSSLRDALASLKVMRLLEGYRNRPRADIDQLLDALTAISEMAQQLAHKLIEMDINPILVTESGCFAADALIQISDHD